MSSLGWQRQASRAAVRRRIRDSRGVTYGEKARLLCEVERIGPARALAELERLERGRE